MIIQFEYPIWVFQLYSFFFFDTTSRVEFPNAGESGDCVQWGEVRRRNDFMFE